ncbi:uncharacterized protein LOC141819061 [Curcuma longa]|uniref:uncharacterized protein LOC141819061 n=1 Tax=Curcuma longa TaxID=136217 RepID=UPI003D9ED1F7
MKHHIQVGVLIGKTGETIRYLQYNSGAKIKITRDDEADPDSNSSPVELIGSQASFAASRCEIKVPNEKVGIIIGKGGETIKNLQTKSGARIQLIPQLAEGDASKERTHVTGDQRQIESVKEMIKQ